MDENLFLELIQLAIGRRDRLSATPSGEQWESMFDMANDHAVLGICFDGIQKSGIKPSQDVFMKWLALVVQIQQRNKIMDLRTAKVWQRLKQAGLDAAVLKGQGIATLYEGRGKKEDGRDDLSTLRQSGDIDIWVLGGYQKLCDYVQSVAPTTDIAYHRFHFNVFKDTEVELHHRPTLMRNLFDDRKLARWYNSFGGDSFVYLEEKGFAVPLPAFNCIFILTHIYRHFLFEGIGLRQVMDYYFVLRNSSEKLRMEREELRVTLRELRLTRFAEAMMWILHTQFGLEEQFLISGMNEKEGRFVLNEILTTGNFGRADQRYRYKHLRKIRQKLKHGSHLLLHYPSEVLWTPIWLVYHKFWKWNKRRQIKAKE